MHSAACLGSKSSQTIVRDLPPSSRVTGVRRSVNDGYGFSRLAARQWAKIEQAIPRVSLDRTLNS